MLRNLVLLSYAVRIIKTGENGGVLLFAMLQIFAFDNQEGYNDVNKRKIILSSLNTLKGIILSSLQNPTPQLSNSKAAKIKLMVRVTALLLLLGTMMGPWFMDTHPATEETCSPPLVWLGDGYCACLTTFFGSLKVMHMDQSYFWLMWLLPMLPFLSTFLLVLGREKHTFRIFHLISWGLTALFALFFFFVIIWASHFILILWGIGFAGFLAVAMLVGEIWINKRFPDR